MATDIPAALALSLKAGIIAILLNIVPAITIAFFLQGKRKGLRLVLEGFINIPLVLPPLVIGYILLCFLGRHGFIGRYFYVWSGMSIAFSFCAVVLVSMVVSFPFIVHSVRDSLRMLDPSLFEAARSFGAGRRDIAFHIVLPLVFPGVISGCVAGFARCLGEFGATMVFAGNIAGRTQTISLAIYSLLQVPGREREVFLLVSFSVLLSFFASLACFFFSRVTDSHSFSV